jgi:hypothetical protein
MESLHNSIKSQIPNCQEIADIKKIDNQDYKIVFIHTEYSKDYKPRFTIQTKILNLQVQMRDAKIEQLLNSIQSDPIPEFDVEDIIYSDEQKEILNKLRNNSFLPDTKNHWLLLHKVKKEYSDSFQIGDKVKYNGGVGFITFKHTSKNESDITKWSVKIGDTEFRYIEGIELIKRKIQDLSFIPIDPQLDKLSTEKLLKMYKRNRDRNKGVGDLTIKRILQEREHIQKGPNKIKIVG